MFTKENKDRVLEVFFENPDKKYHLRELARMTKISPAGLLKIIAKLKRRGLLEIEDGKVMKQISSSRNEKFLHFKRAWNLFSVYDSGLVSFLQQKYEEPEAIVLFGSYAKGEDISTSDIDMAIVTKKSLKTDLKIFETYLKKRINLHEIKLEDVEKSFINTLANGIVVYGYLQVSR
jgi:predicted nucleotidyltransferase